ncbi:hypothetical protein CTA2_3194 [Colletotrichum tanaceti]|uniref:Uncharacterized protein n=1 Tax=Colletotrichum tanaceti TaxID=1306861 RepID=A0A4U6XQ82_9PEZI|nr:hypothetical protein CTA2_3194 [Colletotrichum tanaceti]TKW57942.1 hypothetical protein CTA1_3062 [Colletotrichum tanaceti]
MDRWAKTLSGFLTSQWRFQKTPHNLSKAVDSTIQSAPNDPYELFFIHGQFQGWVAFVLNPPPPTSELSQEELVRIAKTLAGVKPHESVHQAMLQMETKRRRLDDGIAVKNSARSNVVPTMDYQTPLEPSPPLGAVQHVAHHQRDAEEPTTFVHATIPGLVHVFPEYLSEGITKISIGIQYYAAIQMKFPRNPMHQNYCEMIITVESNTVEHIASVLFGALVQITAFGRELLLPSGARLCGKTIVTYGDMSAARDLFWL